MQARYANEPMPPDLGGKKNPTVLKAKGMEPHAIKGMRRPHLVFVLSDHHPTRGSDTISTNLDIIRARAMKSGDIKAWKLNFWGGR